MHLGKQLPFVSWGNQGPIHGKMHMLHRDVQRRAKRASSRYQERVALQQTLGTSSAGQVSNARCRAHRPTLCCLKSPSIAVKHNDVPRGALLQSWSETSKVSRSCKPAQNGEFDTCWARWQLRRILRVPTLFGSLP